MRQRTFSIAMAATLLASGCISLNRASDVNLFRDPEVAMVLRVLNLAEVREGNAARDKATSTAVRDFAAMMASEHAQAASKTENELAKKDIASADSDLARQIDAQSGQAAESLRARSGADFDRAYMDRQIELHSYIVNIIDTKLRAASKAKQVKKALDDTKATAETHLAKAREIRKGL